MNMASLEYLIPALAEEKRIMNPTSEMLYIVLLRGLAHALWCFLLCPSFWADLIDLKLEASDLKLQCGVVTAFEIPLSTSAVCVIFRCGSASPSVCKPWALFGKGRLWKAQLKQSRMSLLCQLGLQMHPLNVVLQSGSTACNYSIWETTGIVKRSWEQCFPLWPWPKSRMTKVILCEIWALLNLIVSLPSINLHY